MGWIVRAPSGKWKAAYRDPDRRVRSKSFRRKDEAERWLRGAESALDRGSFIDPTLGRIPIRQFYDRYLASAVHLRPKTRLTYDSLARNHILPYLGSKPIGRLSRLDIETWLAELRTRGVSNARAAAAFRVLRAMLSAAEKGDIIGRNPAKGIKAPTVQRKEMRYLTPDEVERIALEVPDRYKALVLLLAYTGLRVGEAIALRVKNVDLLHRRVQVIDAVSEVGSDLVFGPTKSSRSRAVSMPARVRDELATHIQTFPSPDGLVFSDSKGGVIRQTNFIRQVWYPAVERAGVSPRPRMHDLRHTSVALAIAAGAHPKEIQERLGHSSITVTLDRYGHLFPGLDERLAERLDQMARAARGPVSELPA